MRGPKVAICGPGRCGKDTAAMWLAGHTSLRLGKSTSQVIAPFAAQRLGLSVEDAFARRHSDRKYWFDLGNELRARDPTFLVREALREGDIVVGLRNPDEVTASRREGLVDLFIWIERVVPDDPTMAFGADSCDITIINNSSIEDLFARLRSLATFAGILL